jgi:chromosome segregation ATPase
MDATNDFAAKEIQMAADRNRLTQEIEKLKSEISAIDRTASTKLDLADELAKVKTAIYKKREKLQGYRDDRPFDYEQAFAPALKELRADIAALEKRRSELEGLLK